MTVPRDDSRRLAEAAQSMVGCPFLLHGRNPATGLDCVGLVAECLSAIGREPLVPTGYGLRNRTIEQWLTCATRSGLGEVSGDFRPGDIALVSPGAGQHHLIVIGPGGHAVHAHAGLRRVVSQPFSRDFRRIIHWRLLPRKEKGRWPLSY